MTHLAAGIKLRRNAKALSLQAQRRLYIGLLGLSDALMLALAFALAYWVRFGLELPIFRLEVEPSPPFYGRLMLMFVALWLFIFYFFRVYEWENLLGGTEEYALVTNACTVATVLVIAAGFIWPAFVVARGWLLSAWVFTFLCTNGARFWLRRLIYGLRRRGYFIAPALIVGTNAEALALAKQLANWDTSGLDLLGLIGADVPVGQRAASNLHVLGDLDILPDLVARYDVEELIVATSALTAEQLLDIFRRYGADNGVNVRLSSGLYEIITTGLSVKSLGYVPFITVNKLRLSRFEAFVKGYLDYGGAALGLLALSPLLAAIALAVKLDSPGPIIYRRRVLGRGGVPFDAFKFRTMYVNGDDLLTREQWANLQMYHKLKDDPRVTRVGRFLRKYSLDELPQLFNVLRGQMSLLGPRMITLAEKGKYGKWDMNLLTVKPGMSGLWVVSGRSDIPYEERVRLDMHYIRNYTIWLDLQILMRTFVAVLKGKGAY